MKLTPRFKLLASAAAVLTAGLIGCQVHRVGNAPQPIAPEAPRYIEPLPQPQQPLLPPPQTLVPPAEDELPVPSAGLSPIQRTCFTTSCSSCSTCAPTCCSDGCSPSLISKLKAPFYRAGAKMSAVRGHMHGLLSELNPLGGCSSCSTCDPCCSPCVSTCDPCCSGGMMMDGFVVGDCQMPCSTGCGQWAPSGCGANAGVWSPASYPMMPQGPMGYAPQYQHQMPAQAPCNCQSGQASMQHPGYASMPNYGGYAMQPGAQAYQPVPQQQQYQSQYQNPYQYAPQQPQRAQNYSAPAYGPTSGPVPQPGHSQPNYSQPMAVAPQQVLQ